MVLSMDRWVGKVAIVTGASSGIGAAIAELLVEKGLLVVGAARRKENVDALAQKLQGKKGKLYSVKADVAKEEDIKELFKWTSANVGPVSILINNAGCHHKTGLIGGDTAAWRATIDVNLIAVCIATREAIDIMQRNNIDGYIIHINSLFGHTVLNIPDVDVYPATKHGVTALTETLRHELNARKSKIRVTSISPGIVDTEIISNIKKSNAFALIKDAMLKSEDIADAVSYVLSTPQHVQVHEIIIKPQGELL
ncbi:farnesol dehydrogenase isoform X4 [Diabrotica virgifera virgifera]|uniref:Farnesol dehydrogenase-like isoform X2 n=1 Tax=Diabrotica virgifera virgifera TaxID=50390 RepID=A0A6P7G1S1_DIAVI|nr:farnesol dehydrogenase isoform X4 [Diabrotica virgifera virgifera]